MPPIPTSWKPSSLAASYSASLRLTECSTTESVLSWFSTLNKTNDFLTVRENCSFLKTFIEFIQRINSNLDVFKTHLDSFAQLHFYDSLLWLTPQFLQRSFLTFYLKRLFLNTVSAKQLAESAEQSPFFKSVGIDSIICRLKTEKRGSKRWLAAGHSERDSPAFWKNSIL